MTTQINIEILKNNKDKHFWALHLFEDSDDEDNDTDGNL